MPFASRTQLVLVGRVFGGCRSRDHEWVPLPHCSHGGTEPNVWTQTTHFNMIQYVFQYFHRFFFACLELLKCVVRCVVTREPCLGALCLVLARQRMPRTAEMTYHIYRVRYKTDRQRCGWQVQSLPTHLKVKCHIGKFSNFTSGRKTRLWSLEEKCSEGFRPARAWIVLTTTSEPPCDSMRMQSWYLSILGVYFMCMYVHAIYSTHTTHNTTHIYLSIDLSIYLSTYAINQSICLAIYLSINQSINQSV